MYDLIIKNGTILTMNGSRQVLEKGFVAGSGSRIMKVGPMPKMSGMKAKKIIDAKGNLVMPGFINVHSHVGDILLRGGLSQDRSLYDWLLNVLYPGMKACTLDDIRIATRLYVDEAIRAGITTVVDNEDFPEPENHRAMIEIFKKIGIRVIFGRMFSDRAPSGSLLAHCKTMEARSPDVRHVEDYLVQDTHSALSAIENLINEFSFKGMKDNENNNDDLMTFWPSPFNPLWCSKEGLLGSLAIAEKYDTGITIHLAETAIESKHFGVSSTEFLDSIRFLNPRLLAAHCVWLSDKDISLMKRNNVKVAHQPSANMYLGSGFAPIPKMLAAGITIGLGTDDANDNDSVNMISEIRAASLIHKANTLNAASVTADHAIEMATRYGAKALGMESDIGSIEPGKKADIIILDLNAPHLRPIHHIPSALAYQARGSEVETVIINGKIMMEKRKLTWMTEDEESKLLDKAQDASVAVIRRANLELPQSMLLAGRIRGRSY